MPENKLDKILREAKQRLKIKPEKKILLENSIMIVDDDESVVKSLEFVFKDRYRIFSCYSGNDAITKYKQNKDSIAAILLDIKMNGKDGIEVYKELKIINSTVPIIFNTAFPGEYKPLDLLQELHPFGYIVKGSDPAILYDNIYSAVEYFNLIKAKDRLNLQLQEVIFDLKELHKSSQNINSINNQKKLYKEIISQIITVFQCKYVLYFAYENYQWEFINSNVIKEKKIKDTLIELAYKIIPEMEKTKKIFIIDKSDKIKKIKPLKSQINQLQFINNLYALPIVIKNKLNGVVIFVNSKIKIFSDEIHFYVLKTFTNHITISLNNTLMTDEKIKNKELLTIGRTAAMIVHDMNNPLHVINIYLQLMKAEKNYDNQEYYQEITFEVKRVSNMMEELTEFLKKGSRKINLAKCNLNSIIRSCCIKIRKDFISEKIRIELNLNFNGVITIDKEKIIRVLGNILNNAKSAMEKGGKIVISTKKIQQFAEIKISDNGPGMDEKMNKNIFEPFFSSKKSKGIGLGMYIVKQMILQHKGTIDVDSKKDKGSTFTIKLPLKKEN